MSEQSKNAAVSETEVASNSGVDQQCVPISTSSSDNLEGYCDRQNLENGAWAASNHSSNNLFSPVTLFVNSQTSLIELVSDQLGRSRAALLMLTGLHTCGNLSADILRLFVATPSIHVLCQLGCCYNLLSERFLFFPSAPAYGNIFLVALHSRELLGIDDTILVLKQNWL